MEILINSFIVIACVLALAKGSSLFVDSAVKISNWFNIPPLVIGLTVVAFGTSAPEFSVTLLSSFQNMGDVSVGNIVGSNIFNLGFILGGTALVRGLNSDKKSVYRDGAFLLSGTVILTLLIWDLSISRIGGVILFSLLILYIVFLFFQKSETPVDLPTEEDKIKWYDILYFILGLAMIIAGGHFLVESSVKIARIMGVSQWVISVTIVAFGTSAPELATSLTAALKGHHDVSVGNLIGSDIFNIFGVLGLTAILNQLEVEAGVRSNLIVLIGMVLLVIIFMRSRWRISKWEGAVLILIGLLRWLYSFYFAS